MRASIVLGLLVASAGACGSHRDQTPDVVVDRQANGTTVVLGSGQTLGVELASLGDGGFDPWVLATAPARAVLRLTSTGHVPPTRDLPGAFGTDRFEFDAVAAGTTGLAATATRPWSGETATFQLQVVVR
jgi:predicted secreted protein